VRALKTSRILLLLSFLLWGAMLLGGYFGLVPPGLALGIGTYAGVGIGLSAVACVIFQFVIPRNSN
jgi:hypothetical protein